MDGWSLPAPRLQAKTGNLPEKRPLSGRLRPEYPFDSSCLRKKEECQKQGISRTDSRQMPDWQQERRWRTSGLRLTD
jgi:hypothetical protein